MIFSVCPMAGDLTWLVRQVAETCALPRFGMMDVLKALRNYKALETELFVEFDALHSFFTVDPSKRIFTDDLNVSNLKRYLWDYMTVDSLRNHCFQFFFKSPTAQVHRTTAHPIVVFSVLIDSPRLIKEGVVHPDGCRLLIYSLVMEHASTPTQWAHRKRQRASMVGHVVEYINAMEPVNGVSLRAFSKFVSMAVVDGSSEIVAYDDLRKRVEKRAPKLPRDDTTNDAAINLFDEDPCCSKPRQTKKSRRSQKRRAAVALLQACARRYLCARRAKHRASAVIARTIRGIILWRSRRQAAVRIQRCARACMRTQSWVCDRRVAIRLAALESRSQDVISAEICDAREIEAVVEKLLLDVEFGVHFDEAVAHLCKSVTQDALSDAHHHIIRVQSALSSIAGVQIRFQGQVYQMHVARSSELYKRRDDADLARRIISSSQSELLRLFASKFDDGTPEGNVIP